MLCLQNSVFRRFTDYLYTILLSGMGNWRLADRIRPANFFKLLQTIICNIQLHTYLFLMAFFFFLCFGPLKFIVLKIGPQLTLNYPPFYHLKQIRCNIIHCYGTRVFLALYNRSPDNEEMMSSRLDR